MLRMISVAKKSYSVTWVSIRSWSGSRGLSLVASGRERPQGPDVPTWPWPELHQMNAAGGTWKRIDEHSSERKDLYGGPGGRGGGQGGPRQHPLTRTHGSCQLGRRTLWTGGKKREGHLREWPVRTVGWPRVRPTHTTTLLVFDSFDLQKWPFHTSAEYSEQARGLGFICFFLLRELWKVFILWGHQ